MSGSIWEGPPDMQAEQRRVDAEEESAVIRYTVLYDKGLPARIWVRCAICGAVQFARAARGCRWVPLLCILCGQRSIALPGDGA